MGGLEGRGDRQKTVLGVGSGAARAAPGWGLLSLTGSGRVPLPRQRKQTHQDFVSQEVPVQLLKMPELLLGRPGKGAMRQTDRVQGAGSHLGVRGRD